MKTVIQIKLADAVTIPLPELTPREWRLPQIPDKTYAIIGMRRTGKTFFLYQIMGQHLRQGVDCTRLVYFNFEDERLAELTAGDLHWIVDQYYAMFPEHRDEKVYFFLDEIQLIDGWERFIRRLMDTENVQIYISGSSAKMLSREIASSMRGRSVEVVISPYSFVEFLRHHAIEPPVSIRQFSKKMCSLLENKLLQYLVGGGFPEAQGLATQDRHLLLQGYVNTVLFRDIVERHKVTNITILKKLIRHLVSNNCSKFTVNKFFLQLKSQGIRVAKTTLHEYLDHLRDAFLVQTIPIHSRSERKRMVNPVKSYAIDTGLASAFSISREPDLGLLLENCIFMELYRRQARITYLITASGYEVDFVAEYPNGTVDVIQVSSDISASETREREIRALREAKKEIPDAGLLLITINEEAVDMSPIRIIPAWKWLIKPDW